MFSFWEILSLKFNFMKANYPIFFLLLVIASSVVSCKEESNTDENVVVQNGPYQIEYGSLPAPNIPEDNPLTIQGVKLGRMLFYEKALSRDNSISCASCHSQGNAFSDTNRLSLGVDDSEGKRQAMAIFNMLWNSNEFFWDGRAHLLRDQAVMPIEDQLEMKETLENVIDKLSARPEYREQFQYAFGSEGIDSERIALALEQFMNSMVTFNSKFDRYLAGEDTLTAEEERGRFLYFTEYNPAFPENSGADCQHCHGGANFENDKYMNNGLDSDAEFEDVGREAVTGNPNDRAKFKVPSLRNVAVTQPYMHDGRFETLEEVVDHYNLVKESSTLDGSFYQQLPNGLELSVSDKKALVAFLKTLTDEGFLQDERFADPF